MDNLVFSFLRKPISILHWIFYGFHIFLVIFNAEIYFYGTKYSGDSAIIIYFTLGISGILIGFFIFKQKRIAYFFSIILFTIILIDILVNHIF